MFYKIKYNINIMDIIHFLKIFLIILILFILINSLSNIFLLNKYEHFQSNKKICCLYAYYEKNELYKSNLEYFLKNGILDEVDYYIIINGDCTIDFPKNENIKIFYRENQGYDFGAYSYGIKQLDKEYDYYFFLNTSVSGPYLKDNKKWIDPFLELFNNQNIKLVGTSINVFTNKTVGTYENIYHLNEIYNKEIPFTHVQSMFFCIDNQYFNFLKDINFFNEDELNNCDNISYVIATKEIGLSQHALKEGWNINSILDKYKNIDYRNIYKDFNDTSLNGDPYYKNAYFGTTIDKYDAIFYKNNRELSE